MLAEQVSTGQPVRKCKHTTYCRLFWGSKLFIFYSTPLRFWSSESSLNFLCSFSLFYQSYERFYSHTTNITEKGVPPAPTVTDNRTTNVPRKHKRKTIANIYFNLHFFKPLTFFSCYHCSASLVSGGSFVFALFNKPTGWWQQLSPACINEYNRYQVSNRWNMFVFFFFQVLWFFLPFGCRRTTCSRVSLIMFSSSSSDRASAISVVFLALFFILLSPLFILFSPLRFWWENGAGLSKQQRQWHYSFFSSSSCCVVAYIHHHHHHN